VPSFLLSDLTTLNNPTKDPASGDPGLRKEFLTMTSQEHPFSFMKIHGNGNDFILMDNRKGHCKESLYPALAQALCPRRTALGADGLLLLEEDPTREIPLGMRIINSDGLEGEMCGNGARSFARYLVEKKLCPPEEIRFRTKAGIMHATASGSSVRLDLGIMDCTPLEREHSLILKNRKIRYRFLRVGEAGGAGVPHAVISLEENKLENLSLKELHELGRQVRYATQAFPEGTNVNFLSLEGGTVRVRTYERGVEDFTLSCGTGSIASVAALGYMRGEDLRKSRIISVQNPGGVNRVHLLPREESPDLHRVLLEGATFVVCTGEIVEDLRKAAEELLA
jgi:diaminopimelate epimerase